MKVWNMHAWEFWYYVWMFFRRHGISNFYTFNYLAQMTFECFSGDMLYLICIYFIHFDLAQMKLCNHSKTSIHTWLRLSFSIPEFVITNISSADEGDFLDNTWASEIPAHIMKILQWGGYFG